MGKLHVINCADCGGERATKQPNTKYCRICSIIRNLKYLDNRTTKCAVCDEEFAPLTRNEMMCGKCDPIPVAGEPMGDCRLCGMEDVPLLDDNIAICRPCSTNKSKRKKFLGAVVQKQAMVRAGTVELVIPPKLAEQLEARSFKEELETIDTDNAPVI